MTNTQLDILIASIDTNGQNTASEVRAVLTAIKNESCKVGEVKQSFFSGAYLTANFNSTGLGINEMEGFALCNGQNGTYDMRRRTPVCYDPTTYVSGNNYSVVGNTFGEENHTLIEAELPVINIQGHIPVAGTTAGGGTGFQPYASGTADTIGGGQSHNNMQPSIVSVFYQRIA